MTKRNDNHGAAKSYRQLAAEFPDCKGYAMMADRERVMGVRAPMPKSPAGRPTGKPKEHR